MFVSPAEVVAKMGAKEQKLGEAVSKLGVAHALDVVRNVFLPVGPLAPGEAGVKKAQAQPVVAAAYDGAPERLLAALVPPYLTLAAIRDVVGSQGSAASPAPAIPGNAPWAVCFGCSMCARDPGASPPEQACDGASWLHHPVCPPLTLSSFVPFAPAPSVLDRPSDAAALTPPAPTPPGVAVGLSTLFAYWDHVAASRPHEFLEPMKALAQIMGGFSFQVGSRGRARVCLCACSIIPVRICSECVCSCICAQGHWLACICCCALLSFPRPVPVTCRACLKMARVCCLASPPFSTPCWRVTAGPPSPPRPCAPSWHAPAARYAPVCVRERARENVCIRVCMLGCVSPVFSSRAILF